jgi:hypothetical protein
MFAQYPQMTNTFKLSNFKMSKFLNFKITMGANMIKGTMIAPFVTTYP